MLALFAEGNGSGTAAQGCCCTADVWSVSCINQQSAVANPPATAGSLCAWSLSPSSLCALSLCPILWLSSHLGFASLSVALQSMISSYFPGWKEISKHPRTFQLSHTRAALP